MAERDAFFIGWAAPGGALGSFLLGIGAGLIVLFAGLGYIVAATQDDPGGGAFVGQVQATGVVQAEPYPMLHVIESARLDAGTTVLLYGQGKRGVAERVAPLDGQLVALNGMLIQRGDIAGIQLGRQLEPAPGNASVPAPGNASVPAAELLGRWRLTGEICDGKCYVGAMRPGRGLAHKACAMLCIDGGLPPVFVATDAVGGSAFFVLADAGGGPVTEPLTDHVAVLVEAEGRVERHGDLMVFAIDPASVRRAD